LTFDRSILLNVYMSDSERADILRGTLDLLILKTLDSLGPLHGYGIAQRIQQVSGDLLALNQGTLYPAVLRLEQRGWIRSKMGVSDNNRKARFYALTAAGRRQLRQETSDWLRASAIINSILATK
jgi:PadR family transcriptional regulator